MIGSLAYLLVRSARNRVLSQLRRVRNPRYALAVLVGVAYFWMVVFRSRTRAAMPSPAPGEAVQLLMPLGLLVLVAWAWVFGSDRTALSFTQAEVSLLFTAPVSRRTLIGYKLVRVQGALLFTSVVWAVLFGRGAAGSGMLVRALAFWVLLSTLFLHRLGAALVRASQTEHGITGMRRSWIPIVAVAAVVVAMITGLLDARSSFVVAKDGGGVLSALSSGLDRSPIRWVMLPFRVALAPVFAPAGAAWSRAMLAAGALLLLHVWWVLRMDAAFEEAAVEASAATARRTAALRARRSGRGAPLAKSAKRTLKLSPVGPPVVAILWKNSLWLLRTGLYRSLLWPPLVALAAAVALAGRSDVGELVVAALCAMLVIMMLIFGPMTVRNDLRGELLHLPLLNTFPLRGEQIVRAEVASSAPTVAAMQFLLLVAAATALSFTTEAAFPPELRIGVLLGAPLLLLGINAVTFSIHNGMALLFPAWVRLGEAGAGLEAIGQSMLTTGATLLVLALLLIVPTVAGSLAFLLLRTQPGLAVATAGVLAGLLLGTEAWVMTGMLGAALERTEPGDVQ